MGEDGRVDENCRIARHVRVMGRVQGVWYRGWTVRRASDLKLDGWVRNRSDGSVEAVFAGPAARVAEMIRDCGEGPSHAAVTNVDEAEAEDPGPVGFDQRPTV